MRLPRLDWIDRDGKLLILAGCVSAVVSASLNPGVISGSDFPVMLAYFAGGIGGLFIIIAVVFFAEKIGRRRLLVLLALTSAATAAAIGLANSFLILLPSVFFGTLSRTSIVRAVLQASLADTAPPNRRTDLYAIYHIAKSLAYLPLVLISALFLLFSALPGLNEAFLDAASATASVLLLLAAAFLYSRVSSGVEVPVEKRKAINPFKLPSRRVIFTLAGLLGLNTLAATLLYHSVTFHLNIKWSAEEPGELIRTTLLTSILSGILAITSSLAGGQDSQPGWTCEDPSVYTNALALIFYSFLYCISYPQ